MSGGDSNLSQPETAGPEERGRPGFPGGQLRPAEVRELWFFLHGDRPGRDDEPRPGPPTDVSTR